MIAAYRWIQNQQQAEFTKISREDVLKAIVACCPPKGRLTEPDFQNMDQCQKSLLFNEEIETLGNKALDNDLRMRAMAASLKGMDVLELLAQLGLKALSVSRMRQIWQETEPTDNILSGLAYAKKQGYAEQMYDAQQVRDEDNIFALKSAGLGGVLELLNLMSNRYNCACVRRIASSLSRILPFLPHEEADYEETPYPAMPPNLIWAYLMS